MLVRLSIFAFLLILVTGEKFFDPTHADFKKCGFAKPSLLCDPNHVLTNAERTHLNTELNAMEARSSLRAKGEKKGNCSLAGITPAIYVVKNGEEEKIEAITTYMKSAWTLDKACGNDLMIVISANETNYHVYRNPDAAHQTALAPFDVSHYIIREAPNLVAGKTGTALSNVLAKSLKRATAKYPLWTPASFPNPMKGGHAKCGLKAAGPLCDPDGIFDEEEKQVILENIGIFEEQTRKSPVALTHNSSAFCREKGYSIGIAVMRKVEGGTQKKAAEIARTMIDTWKLDDKCGKAFVLAITVDDSFFSVRAPDDSLLRMDKFIKYFEDASTEFARAELRTALRQIFSSAVEDARSGALFSLFNRKRRSVSWKL